MRNAALAGLLAICLFAGLAIFGVKDRVAENRQALTNNRTITLAAVGDIMLSRQVGTLMDKNGYDYPFRDISPFLKNFDLVFANFEGTVSDHYNYKDGLDLKFSFSPRALPQLSDAHVGVVSVANNHGYDYGSIGFEETKKKLQAEGISPVGHPLDVTKGIVTTVDVKDKQLTFLAFNATYPSFDPKKAVELITKTRTENPDSFLILSMHWGDEYKAVHNRSQETFAHQAIDAGVDIILGHHPHVIQDIELYKGKLVFYSLGNFVFDQNFSEATQEGLLLGIQLEGDTVEAGLFPVHIDHSQPKVMGKERRTALLAALAAKSTPELRAQIAEGLIRLP